MVPVVSNLLAIGLITFRIHLPRSTFIYNTIVNTGANTQTHPTNVKHLHHPLCLIETVKHFKGTLTFPNRLHLKIGPNCPKRKSITPTNNFQVRVFAVGF